MKHGGRPVDTQTFILCWAKEKKTQHNQYKTGRKQNLQASALSVKGNKRKSHKN